MYDLGDELSVESYRIPWLIWIQVLVLFLLFFLLYCFSLFTSDLSEIPTSSSSSSHDTSSFDIKPVLKVCNTSAVTANRLQHRQVGENRSIKGEIAPSTGRRIVAENNVESQSSHIGFHPCNYFRLAKLAFLKCLGLDSSSENSSRPERQKDR